MMFTSCPPSTSSVWHARRERQRQARARDAVRISELEKEIEQATWKIWQLSEQLHWWQKVKLVDSKCTPQMSKVSNTRFATQVAHALAEVTDHAKHRFGEVTAMVASTLGAVSDKMTADDPITSRDNAKEEPSKIETIAVHSMSMDRDVQTEDVVIGSADHITPEEAQHMIQAASDQSAALVTNAAKEQITLLSERYESRMAEMKNYVDVLEARLVERQDGKEVEQNLSMRRVSEHSTAQSGSCPCRDQAGNSSAPAGWHYFEDSWFPPSEPCRYLQKIADKNAAELMAEEVLEKAATIPAANETSRKNPKQRQRIDPEDLWFKDGVRKPDPKHKTKKI